MRYYRMRASELLKICLRNIYTPMRCRLLMRTRVQVLAVLNVIDLSVAGAHAGCEVACVNIFCSENF